MVRKVQKIVPFKEIYVIIVPVKKKHEFSSCPSERLGKLDRGNSAQPEKHVSSTSLCEFRTHVNRKNC